MSFRDKSLLILSILATGGCAGIGLSDEPYGLLESGVRSAVRKELPVVIYAVDGDYRLYQRRFEPVKPGRHVLEVDFNTDVGPSWKRRKTVEIDVSPCTRYRIVARYGNLTHVEWIPVVYPERIGECMSRFGLEDALGAFGHRAKRLAGFTTPTLPPPLLCGRSCFLRSSPASESRSVI